jgi:archaellum component FlaG (FlaF/FlaG flagellin family)
MADGGASTYIMLITALLVSSSASAVLIQEWSSSSRVIQHQQRGLQLSEELGIDFAGDPMNVNLVPLTDTITFYILNTGEHTMNETKMEVLIDGLSISSSEVTTSFVGSATDWHPNVMVEVEVSNSSFSSYNDGDDISIFTTVVSDSVSGMSASASFGVEVRLDV